MGIEARAESLPAILREMAKGLKALMFGESRALAEMDSEIAVQADDLTELLVCWLNEVTYWCEKDNLVPAEFCISQLGKTGLRATVSGEPFDPMRHTVERQVKSVTYHQACLVETPEGWYARVYVDL